MKRFFRFLFVSLIIVVCAFSLFEFSKQYRVSTVKNNVKWNIVAKNCKDSIGFDKDNNGNVYLVYKTYIKAIEKDGREKILLKDDNLDIEDMLLHNNRIYLISKDEVKEYDLGKNKLSTILKGIPSKGKYLNRNLIIKDNKLLLSIGSATNSGIADNDGNIESSYVEYDKTPINITLNGYNYGDKNTGAFMPYGNSSSKDQKIEACEIGNASIIQIDLENKNKVSLYACGIRNITGWDLDSENELVAIVGGMEDKGSRPIIRDFDYIYKIEKGNWYGWPDFSGGDPISSPRFKRENTVMPLIKNPPNKIVSSPIFQYDDVGIIKYLAIDKDGYVLDKNSKVYYNSSNNMIESISEDLITSELLRLKDESRIAKIKYIDKSIYILDSGMGCIYKLESNKLYSKFQLPKIIWLFLILFGLILTLVIIIKSNKKTER